MISQSLRDETRARIFSLTADERDEIALMATLCCELYHSCEGYDWVGFYRVTGAEMLKIGPYQGGAWLSYDPLWQRGLWRCSPHQRNSAC